MDELRTEVWDFLYRAQGQKSIDEIGQHVNRDSAAVRAAIDHDWFKVVEEMVTIAYGT